MTRSADGATANGPQFPDAPRYLRDLSHAIRDRDPDAHAVSFRPEAWTRALGHHSEVETLTDRFRAGVITRHDLVRLAAQGVAGRRSLVVATRMWGYGTKGRGILNARRVLADVRLDETLAAAAAAFDGDDPLVAAYEAFDVGLAGYGEPFFAGTMTFPCRCRSKRSEY